MPSFDVVSQVDRQEIDNALNQTRKEVSQRYDFKGSKTDIGQEGDDIHIVSDDDHKVKAVVDVLQSKLVRRGVALKALVYGSIEPAAGGLAKQTITVQQGIDTDKAKAIVKLIKDAKLKVQAQIQADQVRVSGKKRDDLQTAIQLLKQHDLDLPLQFINFRE
jgi:cyclic-di-GMP-binding protein